MTWLTWIIIAIALVIMEVVTPSIFFFLCLGIGAFFAAIAAYFNVSNWLEFGVFAVMSVVSIYTIRPIFKKAMAKQETVKSNVDELVGAKAVVTGKILPSKAGFVKVQSEIWLAESDEEINEGETVIIQEVSGTKVIVKK